MNSVQTHLEKIRSDAAECMLLSRLVADGKGQVFIKTAEHLNALALELEQTTKSVLPAAGVESVPGQFAGGLEECVAPSSIKDLQNQVRPRKMLTMLLLCLVVVGSVLGASSEKAREYWSFYLLRPTQKIPFASSEQTTQVVTALLSQEQAERKKIMEQLNELTARLDVLVTSLKNADPAREQIAERANNDLAVPEEKSGRSAAKGPGPSEGEKSATDENLAPARERASSTTPADAVLPESVDRVGAIANSKRAEATNRRAAAGPQGCTQFRSFDPVSQTYTTWDGRRRECRQ
ncbi:BA14K family protein [Bradyrhizobium sp. CB3481]|uniref:BA14K family protein n=1 Tax=Bradyrhizobium sp. CB3481 TaxID=3039158 RepID=UPI0024B06D4C|nr:BA14K family protein [Bradyrhizobium sp. CB3481]WFU18729.1 BA14K family protein [Bradyrhizobium sp. CB3481]